MMARGRAALFTLSLHLFATACGQQCSVDCPDLDAYGNPRAAAGEAAAAAKWVAAFEREERDWQEGDVFDERTGKISAGRRRGATTT